LLAAATAEFDGKPITSEASSALRQFIQHGAPKVTDEDKAVSDMKKFAREMLRNANRDQGTGEKQIDLESFKSAKASVCPLYPFC